MSGYLNEVDNDGDFQESRLAWIDLLRKDNNFNEHLKKSLEYLEQKKYFYFWDWMGIPIIKSPEEIQIIQEAIYRYKPTLIVEVGVARGGSLALYHSLQVLNGIKPQIIGVDIKYFHHTLNALNKYLSNGIELLEGDSTSDHIRNSLKERINKHKNIFVILDGDHSQEKVLLELNMFDELLPADSLILCADTFLHIIEQSNATRTWTRDNNPHTALEIFLKINNKWKRNSELCRKVFFGESPGGWIQKVH